MSTRMATKPERIEGLRKAIAEMKRTIIASHLGDSMPIGRKETAEKKIAEYEDKIKELEKEIKNEEAGSKEMAN